MDETPQCVYFTDRVSFVFLFIIENHHNYDIDDSTNIRMTSNHLWVYIGTSRSSMKGKMSFTKTKKKSWFSTFFSYNIFKNKL